MPGAFDDVNLPEDIEEGALIGPSFQTTLVTLSGGGEQRNSDWDQERLTADIAYGIMRRENPADVEDSFARVLAFFRARRGRHRGFRFKDWADYRCEFEPVYKNPLSPTEWQLTKRYDEYLRRLTRPRFDNLALYHMGEQIPQPGGIVGDVTFSAWRLSELGIIVFDAEPVVDELQASFEFDIPVRFDVDQLSVSLNHEDAGAIQSIRLIQIRE